MKQLLFIGNALFVTLILGLYSAGLLGNDEEYYILGFFGQFALGIFQLIVALTLTISAFREKHTTLTKLLRIYWGLVCLYIVMGCIAYLGDLDIFMNPVFPVAIGGVPITIAIYFVYITYTYAYLKQDDERT